MKAEHKLGVPRAPARRVAESVIVEAQAAMRDIFGPAKSHRRPHVQIRHAAIKAVHEQWPQASFKSIAETFGLDHSTVLTILGRRHDARRA